MTPEEASALLDSTMNLALATVGRDGYPHVVAMSFAVDNGDIVMTSYGKAQKVLNLERDPHATVMVERGTAYNALKGVMIRGRAELIAKPEAVLEVMRLMGKKTARLAGGGAPPMPEMNSEARTRQASKRVVIRIKPEKWASWDHSKLPAGTY